MQSAPAAKTAHIARRLAIQRTDHSRSLRNMVQYQVPGRNRTGAVLHVKDHGPDDEVKGSIPLNDTAARTAVPKEYILKTVGLPGYRGANASTGFHARSEKKQDIRPAIKYAAK